MASQGCEQHVTYPGCQGFWWGKPKPTAKWWRLSLFQPRTDPESTESDWSRWSPGRTLCAVQKGIMISSLTERSTIAQYCVHNTVLHIRSPFRWGKRQCSPGGCCGPGPSCAPLTPSWWSPGGCRSSWTFRCEDLATASSDWGTNRTATRKKTEHFIHNIAFHLLNLDQRPGYWEWTPTIPPECRFSNNDWTKCMLLTY